MAKRAPIAGSLIAALMIAGCGDTGTAPGDGNHAPQFVTEPPLRVYRDQQHV